MFEPHKLNRELEDKPLLLASLKRYGFRASGAISVAPMNGTRKHPVIQGHHRLHYAERLKLPVWYIVEEPIDIYELEGDSGVRWDLRDFLYSRARGGDEACAAVLAFQKKHGLPQGAAISLMGGESAGNKNKDNAVKRGTFKIAGDLSHAKAVVDVTDFLRERGLSFATQAALVKALSKALRVPEFDANILKHRFTQAPDMFQKRTSTEGYIDELEALYNYGAKRKRLALSFRVREVGRKRQETFGRKPA